MAGARSRIAIALGLAAAMPVAAERTQAQLTATFKDRDLARSASPASPVACGIDWVEIADERRSRDIVGVIGRRAVLAPADTVAWMRAVLGGLAARGFGVTFEASPPDPAAAAARLTLQLAAIDSTPSTFNGVVMLRVRARGRAGRTLDQVYRGRVSRTAYWSAGSDTMQSAIDGAFADALDKVAIDLKQVCAG